MSRPSSPVAKSAPYKPGPTVFNVEHVALVGDSLILWDCLNGPKPEGPKLAGEGYIMEAVELAKKGCKFSHALENYPDFAKAIQIARIAKRAAVHHGATAVDPEEGYTRKMYAYRERRRSWAKYRGSHYYG